MADTKLTGLTEETAPISTDLLYMVDDPGSTPASRKVTFANAGKGIRNWLGYYDPDVPPASPGAYDDEFDDDSVDVAWSFTGTPDESFDLMQSSNAAHRSESIYHGHMLLQSTVMSRAFIPAIDQAFTVVAKAYVGWQAGASDSSIYLTVWGQNANCEWRLAVGSPSGGQSYARTVYNNNGGAAQGALVLFGGSTIYMMLTHDGAKNFSAFVSSNGRAWMCVEKDRALSDWTSFTSLSIDMQPQGDPDGISAIEFVRYFTTEGQYKIGKDV